MWYWKLLYVAFIAAVFYCAGFIRAVVLMQRREREAEAKAAQAEKDKRRFDIQIGVMSWRKEDREIYLASSN